MPVVSSYLKNSFRQFVEDYVHKQQHPVYNWLVSLFFSKNLRSILDGLAKSPNNAYSSDDVKKSLHELGKMSHFMVWLAGFFFQFMNSRVLYVYRFLNVMHQASKNDVNKNALDFVTYPFLEELVEQFDFFWLAEHWSDIQQRVIYHAQPFSLIHALISLSKSNMLYDWSISKILPILMKHQEPLKLVTPLKLLADANMLIGHEGYANLVGLEQSPTPEDWVHALIELKQIGFLNQNTRVILLTQSKPLTFSKFLVCLFLSGRFSLNQYTAILSETVPFSPILTSQRLSRFWLHIPQGGITSVIYQQILDICRLSNLTLRQKEERLAQFLNQTFFPNQPDFLMEENRNNFNPSQSVHTASINQSVRDSILSLKKRYEVETNNGQKVLKYYEKLKNLVLDKCSLIESDLSKKIKCQAARRALQRIDTGELNYLEKVTNTDIFSLFALIYCAVHDKERIKADLDDFLVLLIDSLYELQRGYNLSETAEDNHLSDKSICTGGSFAKIFESICALHQDCYLIYVTAQSITNKMICVVNQEVKDYLNKFAYPESLKVLNDLKANGLNGDIWQIIKSEVEAKMHAEFDDVLGMSSVSKTDFLNILDSANEVPLYLEDYQPSLSNQFFGDGSISAESIRERQFTI